MLNYYFSFFLISIFTFVNIVKAGIVNVKMYAFAYSENDTYYSELVKRFNEYSTQNSLDIKLDLTILTDKNNTDSKPTYEVANALWNYLKNYDSNSENVDIVTYDLIYSGKFSDYLIDLRPYFSKEKISTFISTSIETCTAPNGELISMPLFSEYGVLGYNQDLLIKYNKGVPTTWDELIETAKFIVESEKVLGNNIIGYTSQHYETETATCSALELLYSGRKKVGEPCPSLLSKEALQVLSTIEKMKKMGIATDDSLNKNEGEIGELLWSGKALFGRNWQFIGNVCNEITVTMMPLCNAVIKNAIIPGYYEGVSASVVGGHNIAIPKSSKNIKEAVKVIDFFLSYDIQKEMISDKLPAIPSVYTENEVCERIDCDLYKNIQAVARPTSYKEYDLYSREFSSNIAKAMKGEMTMEKALTRNRNIVRIQSVEYKSGPSIIINGITIFLFIGCLLSLFFVYCYYDNEHLCFLTTNYWYIYIFGCILILLFVFLNSGNTSSIKCQFRFYLLMMGYCLTNAPIFARLIGNYPRNYGLPKYVRNNMTLVVNFLFFMEMGIGFLWAIFSSFKRQVVNTRNELNESFYICDSDSFIGDFYFNFSLSLNLLMTLGIAYLMFVEWKFPKYYLDLRNFSLIIYSSIAIIILEIVLKYITIRNKNLYYYLHTIPKLFYVAYMTLVIFGLKLYYIQKDIPAEKKTIYTGKDKYKDGQYSYHIIPEESSPSYTNTLISSNHSNYSKSPAQTRSTTVDLMNYSKTSESTITSPEPPKYYNTPNPNNIPTIISNSFQYPESILPSGSAKVLMCGGGNYNYMDVENLLEIMNH